MPFDGRSRLLGASWRRSPRVAVGTVFFLNGLVLATWVPYIPLVKAAHGLGDGALGAVLLAMAIGAVGVLPAAGWLVTRIGSRRATLLAATALALALPLPVLAPTAALVAVTLACLGAANATLDVAMNAQGVAAEAALGRPVLSGFHGLFSLGGLAGATLAVGTMAVGVAAAVHVLAVTFASLAILAALRNALVPAHPTDGSSSPVFAWPPRRLLGLGSLTFCALLAEGAVGDWSAVYLHDDLAASPARAGAGFAGFSLAMAVGRFSGDRLATRLGRSRLLRLSGGLAAAGLAGALVVGRPGPAVVGFVLVGLGLANAVPILFGAAGRVSGLPAGTALAAVATTGYGGFLAGPPAIGFVADAVGLPAALGLVALACAFIGMGAGLVRPRRLPATPTLARAN
jgi:fucose permease